MGITRKPMFTKVWCAVFLTALSILHAGAEPMPRWSDDERIRISEVIVTGRVVEVATGWDGDTIYTYVTLNVGDVLKGWVPERQIILKQLGGRVDDVALVIDGQNPNASQAIDS